MKIRHIRRYYSFLAYLPMLVIMTLSWIVGG
ncbi:hypothetical protein C7M38_00126 [Lactiplantibacillus plantarum]|nr:hypothetical protein C7M38_00126 [Lactiplantibacillus plantarum]QHM49227.1 hypothetical protein C7M40_01173 [Lactiplantibacillus plantarum]